MSILAQVRTCVKQRIYDRCEYFSCMMFAGLIIFSTWQRNSALHFKKGREMFDMFKSKTPAQHAQQKMALEKALLKGGTRTSREIMRDEQRANGTKLGGYGEDVRRALNQRAPFHPSQRRAAE